MQSSIELHKSRDAQYLSIKQQQADNDEQWRQCLIAQLRYLLDESTLQRMPLWQLRAWTAKVTPKPVEPKASEIAADLIARMDKLRRWFDARVPVETVEVGPVQPVVEIDLNAAAECKRAYRASYADTFCGVEPYEFEGADNSDFDSDGRYIYREAN